MALTASTMLPLGTQAPAFALRNIDGKTVSLDDCKSAKALLVMFICNHCPFVIHVRDELAKMGSDYQDKGVAIIAINSNDAETHAADSPDMMAQEAKNIGYGFPYLYDESQAVAKAYQAACTPDFFLFDGDQKLVYRGQLDDSRPNNALPVNGSDLRAAIDAVITGSPVSSEQKSSMGCNIKWKPGNEPKYS